MKTNLERGNFGLPVSTDGLYQWDIKIICIYMYERSDGANKVQIEQCRVIFIKLFCIQSKETGNKRYYEGSKENLKN